MIYSFDGSYPGFLTAIFESFERKHFDVTPVLQNEFSGALFEEHFEIVTDLKKSSRVQKGLTKTLGAKDALDIYKAFLSEKSEVWKALLFIIQQIFLGKIDILQNFGNSHVLLFDKTLTSVNCERHRMKAFIRFQKSEDGMFHAVIEPDFNVLPLITDFFKKRYADQNWLIYDLKRNYGIFYDNIGLSEVQLSPIQKNSLAKSDQIISIDDKELHYQNLWKQYFKSTNIVARKNMKLHLQHVPRRYWKYLVEKQ